MKIGILTFHRAHNYGAVLQCYALQEVLKGMGHEVEIIDYRQPYIEQLYRPILSFRSLLRYASRFQIKAFLYVILTYFRNLKRKIIFEEFRNTYLNCSLKTHGNPIPQNFDVYIIGSDQMWSINCTNGYDPVFWGNFKRPRSSRLYGYAISANGDYRECISEEAIKANVANFNDITFREEATSNDIFQITGLKKGVNLDPTLLANEENWKQLINSKWKSRKYVVVYQVRGNSDDMQQLNLRAKDFAKKHHCKIVNLTKMTYSVQNFVSAIKYAQCVFTSSFHATVFSCIFKTPFYTFQLYDGHDGRYEILLRKLKLDKHLVDFKCDTSESLPVKSDCLEENLTDLQLSSFEYLQTVTNQK